jgi:SAM-dependent methyltransferase
MPGQDECLVVAADATEQDGGWTTPCTVTHREEEYGSQGFDILAAMQHRHFWYRGRHRFLLRAVERHLRAAVNCARPRVIDIGGGCGGWIAYLLAHSRLALAEAALADSSEKALLEARRFLPENVGRFQVDVLSLPWRSRWDAVFLLDVLEHIPDERRALQQLHQALTPGGKLFITVPALNCFWTWNDEAVGHQRRYAKADFRRLAEACGYRMLDTRYFMFFLSPLLLASRFAMSLRTAVRSREGQWELVSRMHRVPWWPVNGLCAAIFAFETPLGHWLPFPWGTSLLAVLERA